MKEITCGICKEKKTENYFVIYDKEGKENYKICLDCAKKKGIIK